VEVMHVPGVPRAASWRERFYCLAMKICIAADVRSAAAVRVINQHETPAFLSASGVPAAKVVYVPAFYIDLEVFTPQHFDKQYDVIFVGRLARNKGIDLFLDVVRQAGLVAMVVGDGPLRTAIQRRVRREHLKVNMHGHARDAAEVSELMNRSRVLVMTSLNEGGPRVVLESLACGVPVVATPVGIVPDVVPPECIEEWNAEDIAAKVKNLLSDTQLYERVREAGMFTVQPFERKAAIIKYAEMIKKFAR